MEAYTSNTHIIKKRGKRGGRRVKARISRQLEAAYISLYTALEKHKFNIVLTELENTIHQPPYIGIRKSEKKAYFIWYAIARNIGMSKSEIETEQKYFYIPDYDPEEEKRMEAEQKEWEAMYEEEEKYSRRRDYIGNGDDPELLRAMARFYGN
jgi:hypothetical protein